jgi:Na+-translocating ferredoxin:NAD+ oxidoreductase RnfC subunit
MDCIAMVTATPARMWSDEDAREARRRFGARNLRLAREHAENEEHRLGKAAAKLAELEASDPAADPALRAKKARVAAAIERARQRRLST